MVKESHTAKEIVENLPIGVITVDQKMHVLHMNPTSEELTGYGSSEAVGKRLPQLFGPGLWAEGSALQQAMRTGGRVEPRAGAVTKAATDSAAQAGQPPSRAQAPQRQLLIGASPIGGPPARYLISLQEASPFHQIGPDRVSDISHDIRGPLASIQAYTELLVDGVDEGDPELRQQFLDVIDQRTRHLTGLIVNLTSLLRWDLGYLEMSRARVSLRDLVSEAVAALQVQARQQGVRLILDAAGEGQEADHTITADRDTVCTLLRNVIGNAVKFSRTEGDVVVSLRRAGQDEVVTVTDQGCGIRPEDMPHIFEPFYRGGNATAAGIEGSGLGLAVVRAIVEAHGAAIDVESEEGEGTRVTIKLPAEEGRARRP
jgi:signal transduction histidine kinase